MSDAAVANTPSSGTGATPSPSTSTPTPTTSTPTAATLTQAKGNAMSPSEFRNRLRGTSDESFETEAADPDDAEVESPEETTFQASDDEETEAPQLEETEEEASPEEDNTWLEALKEYKQIHGLDLVDLVKALAAGQLPAELQDIIKIQMKNGDEEWESPISKARKEAMLHHDYTAKLQALSKEKQEYHADKDEFVGMLQNWKGNPEALLDGLERLEFPVLEAAKLLAARHRKLDAMTPAERELHEENAALKREQNKIRYEQRRGQETEGKKQTEALATKRSDFVSTTAQQLFQKHQVPMDERTWRVFLGKFKIISDSFPPGAEWTADMVENAFEATHYDYQQALAKREKAQVGATPPKPKAKFDSPAREAVAKLQQPSSQQRKGQKGGAMTAKDFRKLALGR